MVNYILIGVYMVLTVSGVILFKLGVEKEPLVSISIGMSSFKISFISILGLLSYVCSFLMYMFLISKFDLTYIVPVTTGVISVATFILAVLIFKETLTLSKIAGSILILLGVAIINFKK
ncbi:EamA family transporter [Clostridium vincentii]|uniref:EamA-like transporter family protein n=1 Tax=Clostridium vincentii TaxID=52704 RepID=A0A2T0BGU0_9CLOT|nr:EamA family transporter [Clostridium vincentii]PRR83047.1 EamA-like transporter family protein [Clostridium vincentii]